MKDERDRVIVRKLNARDDSRAVAELIYYTDDYIFPYLYDNDLERARAVLCEMIASDTLYHYKNITAAVLDEKIVGIVVAIEKPFTVTPESMIDCFVRAGAIVDERFRKVYREYYALLDTRSEGVYIANVCVNKLYRGMGIAKKMLGAVLSDDCRYELETVKANGAAFAVYTSAGFRTEYEYPGFTAVPCYKMTREKRVKREG